MKRIQIIIFGFIGVVAILMVLLLLGVIEPGGNGPTSFSITIWGTQDRQNLWMTLANQYKNETGGNAVVTYVKKDPRTYESELLNALASGKGPDVFFLTDETLPSFVDKINALADGSQGYRARDLETMFADGVISVITNEQGGLLGTPLAFDTIALFYNRDHFNSANIPNPPATWDELAEDARKLTKFSSVGSITRSGAALGTAGNTQHAPDILAALIYQSGGNIVNAAERRSDIQSDATKSALAFYTAFSDSTKRSYSWNASLAQSLDAFARGDASMVFGYASDAIRIVETNPQLNFDVAPIPQINAENARMNVGTFPILVVSRISSEREGAWAFLLWLQEKEAERTYIDAVGLPPARRDLVGTKPPQEYLGAFYDQVLSGRTLPATARGSSRPVLTNLIAAVAGKGLPIDQAISQAGFELSGLLREPE